MSSLIATSASGMLIDQSFEYTSTGSLAKVTDNIHAEESMYTYDQLNRIKNVNGAVDQEFRYDAFGNRALKQGGGVTDKFDEHNRLTLDSGVTYDAAGESSPMGSTATATTAMV